MLYESIVCSTQWAALGAVKARTAGMTSSCGVMWHNNNHILESSDSLYRVRLLISLNTIDNCIVLYCIMMPYTEGRLDRYHIGIPRELSEIRTQPWLNEGSLTCDPCHHKGPII